MKNKIKIIILLSFFIFCFVVFFVGLKSSNIYIPKKTFKKVLVEFETQELYSDKKIKSKDIFLNHNFYILNIWSSWCKPCVEEHPKLISLSQNSSAKLIGINYKDNPKNAKNFINNMGNPYSLIITDVDGTISIELGAYGVPETFLINKKNEIIMKFVGPLTDETLSEINKIIK